ncbi:MAG TPA: hypothetical protein VFQ53_30720 [Kofleriaceae bacterium]|nr:hypothetical protein [Kofleriaceae bacterium]
MRALVIAAVVTLASARAAEAASIPVIYQTGQATFTSGPLPEPYASQPAYAGFSAGYVCDVDGVFWSYFSVENCKPAAVQGDRYDDTATLGAAIRAKYASAVIPFWAAHGWQLLIGLVGFAALGGIVLRMRPHRAPARSHALLDDDDRPDLTRKVKPLALPRQVPVAGMIDSGDLEGRTVPARMTEAEAYAMHQRYGASFDAGRQLARGSVPYVPDADEQATRRGWEPPPRRAK